MLYEFDSWKDLTAKEQAYIAENYKSSDSLSEAIGNMVQDSKINSRRLTTVVDIKQMLDKPPHDLTDSVNSIAEHEEKYMGCALTCSKIDAIDANFSNSLCKDVARGTIKGKLNLIVQINTVRPYKTKRGKNPGQLMAFISAEDGSGALDSITVFPESYQKYRDLLIEGNTVFIQGETSKKENTSVIINKVSQV